MNTETVKAELNEAADLLRSLVQLMDKPGLADAARETATATRLAAILDHLCLAWNCRNWTEQEVADLPQRALRELASRVPNFGHARQLDDDVP